MNFLSINILGLFLLFVIDSIDCQTSSVTSKCVTPDSKMGKCIPIRECSNLLKLLNSQSKDPKVVQFLRSSVCGTAGRDPKVCCSSGLTFKSDLPSSDSCGVPEVSVKIVGGEDAGLGEYPWIAALGYRKPGFPGPEWICGGSLISNRYVLTAAHCLSGINPWELFTVRLGDLDLNNSVKDYATPINVAVEQGIPHEKYVTSPVANDIALVKLRTPVQFTGLIKPICLPMANEIRYANLVSQYAFVAGWGKTAYGGTFSTHLQNVRLPILNVNVCKEAYKTIPRSYVDDKNICAGFIEGRKDSCQGDSGSPLMWSNASESKYYLVGVVSYGYKCAEPGYPGVYTKVSEYVDWIKLNAN